MHARIAPTVEQRSCKSMVGGSNPSAGTKAQRGARRGIRTRQGAVAMSDCVASRRRRAGIRSSGPNSWIDAQRRRGIPLRAQMHVGRYRKVPPHMHISGCCDSNPFEGVAGSADAEFGPVDRIRGKTELSPHLVQGNGRGERFARQWRKPAIGRTMNSRVDRG